jgi:hypothetical protein
MTPFRGTSCFSAGTSLRFVVAAFLLAAISSGQAFPPNSAGSTGTIPVVFSGPGADASLFRTEARLFNQSGVPASGTLVITPEGPPIRRRSLPYSLGPWEVQTVDLTLFFASVDIVPTTGPGPVATVRIFNDLGPVGTFGFSESDVPPTDAIQSGGQSVLIGPADIGDFRFNVGFSSTLTAGATVSVTVRRGDGSTVGSVSLLELGFLQLPAEQMIGAPLEPGMSFVFRVTSGAAIIYGVTADNRTNDTSFQLARRIGN